VNRTKSLERELTVAIESERTRIGRELHDDLGQRLTGISLSAEILAAQLLPVDRKLAKQADALEQATSHAMVQVRALAHGLVPVASGREGLRDALAHLAEDVTRLSGINCTFDFDDPVDVMDGNISVHLYRIAQEALNNAIRHAHPTSIEIRLDDVDGKIALSIADDGCGFDRHRLDKTESGLQSGLGLNTIASRASIINYDLQIISSVKNGTTIKVIEC
jgi:signal transduction histidine kinase